MLAAGLSGCGYMIGGGYPAQYRTIHVPTFTSESFRRGFELQLTEAVHKQIQDRTPFRLVKSSEADTRLTGHIISVDKRSANQNRFDDPREVELSIAVEVTWTNARTGEVIREQRLAATPLLNQFVSNTAFAPEAGQSLATATQDSVNDLARQVVGMMEGW